MAELYVGNLAYAVTEQDLEQAFGVYGKVEKAKVILDRETGRSRGFGFVTFSSDREAKAAIEALDGQDLAGRSIRVNVAGRHDRDGASGGGRRGYGGR